MRRRGAWAIGAAMLLLIAVLVFDWTWFKPTVQRYVAEHSQRQIDFDKLHIGLTSALKPNVRFENITISNAPWADSEAPLIHAGEMQFVFGWRTLFDHRTIVERLVLRDAQIDLERQVDGHRNWRLANPEDTGPGKVRILALEAERSSLRFLHRGIALDITSRIDGLPSTEPASTGNSSPMPLPITQRIALHGTHRGIAFEGHADVGEMLSFYDTGRPFPLRGELGSGSLKLAIDGRIADIAELGSVDATVRLSGMRLADLAVVWPAAAGASSLAATTYSAEGHWQTAGDHTTLQGLTMRLGSADLSGEVGYWRQSDARPRPRVHAALHGEAIDAQAFDRLARAMRPPSSSTEAKKSADPAATDSLERLDADLQLTIDRVALPHVGTATKLALSAVLNDGQLEVDPVRFELAGGQVSAAARVLPKDGSAAVSFRLALAQLDLGRLSASLPETDRVTGRLDAQANVEAQGASLAGWRASARGDARMSLQGGTITDRLDAELALSGGAFLRTLIASHKRVPVQCAAMTLSLRDGIVSTTRLGLATDRVAVTGRGSLDLRSDVLDGLLTPRRKQSALLALDRSIKVAGTIEAPKLTLVDRIDLPATHGCETMPSGAIASAGK